MKRFREAADNSLVTAIYDPKTYRGGLPCSNASALAVKDISIYGVYQPGTTVPPTGSLVWNVFRGCFSVGMFGFTGAADPGPLRNCMVPLTATIALAPELRDTMSLARVTCGRIDLVSATTSTTNAAINGELSAAAVSELRNLGNHSVVEMQQAAMTSKDAVCNVKTHIGVGAVVGPDISESVTAVNYDFARSSNQDAVLKRTLAPITAGQLVLNLSGGGFNNFGAVPNQVVLDYGLLPFGLTLSLSGTITLGTVAAPVTEAFINFYTVRQAADGTSSPELVTTKILPLVTGLLSHAYNITIDNTFASPILYATVEIWTAGVPQTPTLSGAFDAVFHQAYDACNTSYRVLRWDNITSTQNIAISGTLMIEGVPSGDIAPFVKAGNNLAFISTAPNAIGLMRAAFADPTCRAVRVFSGNMSLIDPALVVPMAPASQALAAGMYASGMYAGGFASAMNNMAGGAAQGFMAGGPAGAALGLGLGAVGALGSLFSGGSVRNGAGLGGQGTRRQPFDLTAEDPVLDFY